MEDKYEQFEYWLADMSDSLENFISNQSNIYDYSVDSLLALEKQLLSEFSSIDDAKKPNNAIRVDGYARYLGEVIRKAIGGKWSISYDDPKNTFYGRPEIVGGTDQTSQICPLAYVITTIHRQRGDFLKSMVTNWVSGI